MTSDHNQHLDQRTLAAEYVLGLLSDADKTNAERRLSTDQAFARTVEDWRRRFSEFDDTTAPRPIGDDLWRRIETVIAGGTARTETAASSWMSFWNSLAFLRGAAMGAGLAALVLAVGLGFAIRAARQQPVMIAVLLDGNHAGAVVQTFADGRHVLLPLTSIEVPRGRALQVWTLPSRERGPVSVGLMDRARTLELSLASLPATRPDQLFEITLEPEAGSPTGRPTGPVLFKGTASLAL
jgi:anti-sigma-K factor RskA